MVMMEMVKIVMVVEMVVILVVEMVYELRLEVVEVTKVLHLNQKNIYFFITNILTNFDKLVLEMVKTVKHC